MNRLIKALKILKNYMELPEENVAYCNHEILIIMINPILVTDEDKKTLELLGFENGDTDYCDECFYSFEHGNCG